MLVDPWERRRFARALRARGLEPVRASEHADRFLVGNAADHDGSGYLAAYSSDVFEHIDPGSLERLVERMPGWLAPGGLALIRPAIWTALRGGHLTQRAQEPWEHLRKRRWTANTYLNKFRKDDYRELFRRHFEIVAEVDPPTVVARLLTPQVREELADYSDDELINGYTLFVLRPRS
jgi:hypothetical protein